MTQPTKDPSTAVAALLDMIKTYALSHLCVIATAAIPESVGTEKERAQLVLDFAGQTGATLTETHEQLRADLTLGEWPGSALLQVYTKIAHPEVATRYIPTVREALEQAFGPMHPEPTR